MNYYVIVVLSFVPVFAVFIAVVRWNKIPPSYYPFVFLVCAGLLNEIISLVVNRLFGNSALNNDIYVFVAAQLIFWQLYNWNKYAVFRSAILISAIMMAVVWIFENWLNRSFDASGSFYRVLSSAVIVVNCIWQMNKVMFRDTAPLHLNERFVIPAAFVLFYTYRAIFEVFYAVELHFATGFYVRLYYIFIIVNLIANGLYAWAMKLIGNRKSFSMPY